MVVYSYVYSAYMRMAVCVPELGLTRDGHTAMRDVCREVGPVFIVKGYEVPAV